MLSLHFCSVYKTELQEGHDSTRIRMTVSWSQQLSLQFSKQLCDTVGCLNKPQQPVTIRLYILSFNMSPLKLLKSEQPFVVKQNLHPKNFVNVVSWLNRNIGAICGINRVVILVKYNPQKYLFFFSSTGKLSHSRKRTFGASIIVALFSKKLSC